MSFLSQSSWLGLGGDLARKVPRGANVPPIDAANGVGAGLLAAFFLGHIVQSSRFVKMYYGVDDNVDPRNNWEALAAKQVSKGKLTPKQVEKIRRVHSLAANSQEAFPVFVSALLIGVVAKLPNKDINSFITTWLTVRALYGAAFVFIEDANASFVRSALFWVANAACFGMFVRSGNKLNSYI